VTPKDGTENAPLTAMPAVTDKMRGDAAEVDIARRLRRDHRAVTSERHEFDREPMRC
jgi:hypothetical protein